MYLYEYKAKKLERGMKNAKTKRYKGVKSYEHCKG
jgi:hypothetical protein